MDETTIQISGLSKSYAGKKVIDNISLTVSSGEVYGLLGANGAGKSTTIECILGTRKADAGQIRILGLDPHKDRKPIFEQVGVQFQESNYPDKIRVKELCEETACLYRQPTEYEPLLSRFGLAERKNAFVTELSGGQKQKLFIILALIADPKVVFLDELTTGLIQKPAECMEKSVGIKRARTDHFSFLSFYGRGRNALRPDQHSKRQSLCLYRDGAGSDGAKLLRKV